MPAIEALYHEWKWYWLIDNEKSSMSFGYPICGIYAELRPGHAYAVCRCPKYLTKEMWTAYARHICDLHNNGLYEGGHRAKSSRDKSR